MSVSFVGSYDIINKRFRKDDEKYNREMIFARFENIANTVYRGNQNSLCMLINDLEEFYDSENGACFNCGFWVFPD